MNQYKTDESRSYHFYTADHFFISLWVAYFRTEGTPKALEKRVARVMNKAPSVSGAGKRAHSRMKLKLLRLLGDHKSYFEKLRRTFFMEDSFPGMAERFDVTYEKVLQKLSGQPPQE